MPGIAVSDASAVSQDAFVLTSACANAVIVRKASSARALNLRATILSNGCLLVRRTRWSCVNVKDFEVWWCCAEVNSCHAKHSVPLPTGWSWQSDLSSEAPMDESQCDDSSIDPKPPT